MDELPVGTKLDLIVAAGELFAESGLDGTSVRAIAEKANANIAAINYHFGSKENLYIEVLRYVVLEGRGKRPTAYLQEDERLHEPGGVAEAIYQIVREEFASFFSPAHPRWHGRLILRSLLDPTPSFQVVLRQIFEPDHEALKAIFLRSSPDMSDKEAQFWAFSLTAQVAFYEFCREPILIHLGRERYDQEFLEAAAEHVARATIAALGLPQPAKGPRDLAVNGDAACDVLAKSEVRE